MNNSKPAAPLAAPTSATEKLVKTAGIELSETELNQVSGGNKVKTAQKAADAVDAFVRG